MGKSSVPTGIQLTRRGLLAGAGIAVAAGAGGLLPTPLRAEGFDGGPCRPGAPRPIPGFEPLIGIPDLHLFLPRPGVEPSTIFDFNGQVAIVDLIGEGVLTNTDDGSEQGVFFRADLRFMKGQYRGLDGTLHRNTYGFI